MACKYRIKKDIYENGVKYFYPQYKILLFWHDFYNEHSVERFLSEEDARSYLSKVMFFNDNKIVKTEIINI